MSRRVHLGNLGQEGLHPKQIVEESQGLRLPGELSAKLLLPCLVERPLHGLVDERSEGWVDHALTAPWRANMSRSLCRASNRRDLTVFAGVASTSAMS